MIYKLEEGVFFSRLICNSGENEYSIDSRTSDAVAIALRFECPIYITEDILEKAGITVNPTEMMYQDQLNLIILSDQTVKYGTYSDEELYKMIDEAIKTEDYERAAAVRDEIEKRKKKKG